MTRQSIFNSVAAHGREAGIEHLHPHQLRRTFATQLYRHRVNLELYRKCSGMPIYGDDRHLYHARQNVCSLPIRYGSQ